MVTHWVMTMIAETQVLGRRACGDVEAIIERAGYVEITDGKYQTRMPRMLQFNSQEIMLVRSSDGVTVIGPGYLLRHIKRKLSAV